MGLIASDVSEDDIVILREYQRFFAEYLDIFEKNFNFKVDPTKVTGRMVKSLSEALSAVDAIDDHFWSSSSWKDVVQLDSSIRVPYELVIFDAIILSILGMLQIKHSAVHFRGLILVYHF